MRSQDFFYVRLKISGHLRVEFRAGHLQYGLRCHVGCAEAVWKRLNARKRVHDVDLASVVGSSEPYGFGERQRADLRVVDGDEQDLRVPGCVRLVMAFLVV